MKNAIVFSVISFFLLVLPAHAASNVRDFHGSGEVITVDPVYSQVTIRHGAIKDFAGDTTTDFNVSSADMLKNIQKGDLVEFDFKDTKGDVKIEKITKTGVAEPENEGSPFGQTVQGVLQGTGDVVRGVTRPLPVANEVGNAVGDTTEATGDALKNTPTESKTKF